VRRAGVVLAVLVVALLTASVTGLLPLQVMRVSSGSMSPTIATGDLVVVERGDAPAQRRDVVALPAPDGRELLVKRVVGVGGDTVSVEDGVLVVNGEPVCEPETDQAALDGLYFGPFPVPDGQLFLLGDDRADSVDSLDFGPLPADTVVGHVRTRLFPHPGRLAADLC
jgi:signal peptidase I